MIHECCFERGIGEFVDAERPQQGIFADALDQVSSADEQTALRAAEQLVSAGGDQIGTKAKAIQQRRFCLHSQIF